VVAFVVCTTDELSFVLNTGNAEIKGRGNGKLGFNCSFVLVQSKK
jgi:hypothetical protein